MLAFTSCKGALVPPPPVVDLTLLLPAAASAPLDVDWLADQCECRYIVVVVICFLLLYFCKSFWYILKTEGRPADENIHWRRGSYSIMRIVDAYDRLCFTKSQ